VFLPVAAKAGMSVAMTSGRVMKASRMCEIRRAK
jgi:hypothetical protein